VLFAEAAVGLGGHWINERRDPVERSRVLGLQRAALARLPPEQEALRCRLAIRLAAEDVYVGGPIEPVQEALAASRRCGDSLALAESLSLCHHALLVSPEHSRQRLELADELVGLASEAGYGLLGLLGLCWRTVDLFQLGDHRAPRALEDLRQRADALACQSILYTVGVMDVMLLIRAGRLEEAEAVAGRYCELGVAAGDVDAPAFFGSQLFAIRWIQGRDAEVLDAAEELARSPTIVTIDFALQSAAAAIAARAGDAERAQVALDPVTTGGLSELPRSSTWLAGMFIITEAAASLGDAGLAKQTYELLSPFADLPVMPAMSVVCLGSTERALGVAAATFGDLDLAVHHLERAIAADRRLGNRPVATITSADLAAILAQRGGGDDCARAAGLLEQAVREADGMGMTIRAERWRAQLDALAGRRGSTTAEADAAPRAGVARADHGGRVTEPPTRRQGLIRREGRSWRVEVDDHRVLVADLVGMGYLAELVAHPDKAIPAGVLAGAGDGGSGGTGSRQELLDRQARDAYTSRARELAAELADAEADNDLGRAERLRLELDALVEQLEAAIGLGGRPRAFPHESERARTSVRKAIKRALDEIAAADPFVAEPLRSGITTGTVCSYSPPPDTLIFWSVHPT
jgi:tetratricopeptide (TPR) repeat protein